MRDYLTLISVNKDLDEVQGYDWTADTALTVYKQNTPDVYKRDTTYRYTQEIWKEEVFDEASAWNDGSEDYDKRLDYRLFSDPEDEADPKIEPLADNDLDNARSTREIVEIIYSVDDVSQPTVGGIESDLFGNKVEMEKEYVRQVDNLDTSYYTYSYYGVDSAANKALESVAIRRLNDTDPAVNATVAGHSVLDDNIYLNADNRDAYIDALETTGDLTSSQATDFKAKAFNDASVQELIKTAFQQTKRTNNTAPISDGLVINHDSDNTDSVDIKSL